MAGATNRFFRLVGSTQSSIAAFGHDHVVDRRLQVPGVDPEPGGGVALRVEVDDQHPVAELGQRSAEVHRGGRLADPTLLVRDRDDPRQLVRPAARRRSRRRRLRPRRPSGSAPRSREARRCPSAAELPARPGSVGIPVQVPAGRRDRPRPEPASRPGSARESGQEQGSRSAPARRRAAPRRGCDRWHQFPRSRRPRQWRLGLPRSPAAPGRAALSEPGLRSARGWRWEQGSERNPESVALAAGGVKGWPAAGGAGVGGVEAGVYRQLGGSAAGGAGAAGASVVACGSSAGGSGVTSG